MTRNYDLFDSGLLMDIEYDEDTFKAIEKALPAMKELHDHLERKMLLAAIEEDLEKMLMYSWRYGDVAGAVTSMETILPYKAPSK